MNKGELVDAVAEKAGVTKKQADQVLTAALDVIVQAVSAADKVTFEPRLRKERDGRNPKTTQTMKIPETVVPAFSAGKLFKEQVGANLSQIKKKIAKDKK
jgi:DNA-binding protein HU-beta